MNEAIRVLINRWGADSAAVSRAIQASIQDRREVGRFIYDFLYKNPRNEANWKIELDPLIEVLARVIESGPSSTAKQFLRFTPVEITAVPARPADSQLKLAVPVDVQTIHSVKGETHDATLVLETKYYQHDVRIILEHLGAPKDKSLPPPSKKTLKMHHRRLFVAMSRPRHLLCLAAAAEFVSEHTRAGLVANGWNVVVL